MINYIKQIDLHHTANQLKMLFYGLFTYLNIKTEAISILAILMGIDTIFGAIKVFRIDHTQFQLKKLLIGFVAKVAFLLIPLIVALAGKGLGFNLVLIVEISIKLLICSEVISIFTNAIAIKTKKEVEDYDVITKFLKYLRNFFIRISDILLTSLKENNKNEKN